MEDPKKYYSFEQVHGYVLEIARQMQRDQWFPDYIVGITRGGLIPATLLSHYLGVRMETLHVELRENSDMGPESNCWMAEDAFGHVPSDYCGKTIDEFAKKKILIVDDINDTGATFKWIKEDWQGSCHPNSKEWDDIWHKNVKFAAIIDNESSRADVDYYGLNINKMAKPEWCVFPWEQWWC